MSRLVVVSNRLPSGRESQRGREPEVPAGGLANAVLAALQRTAGSLWLGWSGKAVREHHPAAPRRIDLAGVELWGLALSEHEVRDYYQGFCNDALWPLLHSFQDKVVLEPEPARVYAAVQHRFADALLPMLRRDDLVWVHDYHLIPLGRELRRRGFQGRIGFFLHTPFPPYEMWQLLPDPVDALLALSEYDLVGFHTQGFLDNYVYCSRRLLGAAWDAPRLRASGRTQRAGVYPIGIDPREFMPGDADEPSARNASELRRVVRGRRILLGVDRLDYTKGIPERILAFEQFIRSQTHWRKKVSFIQIASPSRTDVAQYGEQKSRIESLVGRVNGELAEHDWVPIRYLYRSYGRAQLARFYRQTDVALVTPLRDGMNLVAKEFVAAQRTTSPGVLVLSRCAGAAEDLPEALLVNPYQPADVAAAIGRALAMPIEERVERHAALLARVVTGTAAQWAEWFVEDLEKDRAPSAARVAPRRAGPRPLRP